MAIPSTATQLPRREWGTGWNNAFYFADDETHRQIVALIRSLNSIVEGADLRIAFYRTCTENNGDGADVLVVLHRLFDHKLDNMHSRQENTHTLSDLGSFRSVPE
jgi:hypothetical protein